MPGRYVPPHLRGRGGSDDNNSRTNSSKGTGSSRWGNLEGSSNNHSSSNSRNSSNNNNSNRYNHRYEGRYGDHSNHRRNNGTIHSGNSNGTSRWANVDRSAIEAGNSHSSSRFSGANPQHRNHNFHPRRFHEQKHNHKLEHIGAIFFGDSFIKLFGLLNDYSDSITRTPHTIEVQKYKAASAKGLCREGNDNRAKIVRTAESIRGGNYSNLQRLVFCFGSVDVHMSFYYKKFVQQQPLSETDLIQIANDYIDFLASLKTTTSETNNDKQLTKLVVGIYPSPLCDKDVGASLLAYGSLETEDQVAAVNDSDDKKIECRQARVDLFNQALKDRCEHHNQQPPNNNNGILEYWDVREDLLTIDESTDRIKVKDAYKDVSDLNIHLIHETTLQLWVQKWPWYQALTTMSGDGSNQTTSFLDYLQETFDEYRKTKPWAERTHVAETKGIQLSL